jgi:DNA-binding MarR family transcriptional regulator
MPTPADGAAACNCLALRKAARYLTATYDRSLSSVGLRATQFSILQQLGEHDAMKITDLAELSAMDRTTMAANLKPLARRGLVAVDPSESDRRARIVKITAEGRSLLAAAIPLWRGVQDRFEDRLGGPDEASSLRAVLRAVLATGFDPWAE